MMWWSGSFALNVRFAVPRSISSIPCGTLLGPTVPVVSIMYIILRVRGSPVYQFHVRLSFTLVPYVFAMFVLSSGKFTVSAGS